MRSTTPSEKLEYDGILDTLVVFVASQIGIACGYREGRFSSGLKSLRISSIECTERIHG